MTSTRVTPAGSQAASAVPDRPSKHGATAPGNRLVVRRVPLRRISLLPPEIGKKKAQAKIKFYVIGALAVLGIVLAGIHVGSVTELAAIKKDVKTEERRVTELENDVGVAALRTAVDKQATLTKHSRDLAGALKGEVSLPALLNQLSIVIPDGTWLTSLNFEASAGQEKVASAVPSGATNAPSGKAAALQGGALRITASGVGNNGTQCSHDYAADWVKTMEAWPAIAGVWVSNSTKQGEGLCNIVTFNSEMKIGSSLSTGRGESAQGTGQGTGQ